MLCIVMVNIMAQNPEIIHPLSRSQHLDRGWRFHLGDARDPHRDFGYGENTIFSKSGSAPGTAIDPDFNDSLWSEVDLPHDWAVKLPFRYEKNENLESHGYRAVGPLFPENSIGWYRKSFRLNPNDSSKRWLLRFDGIFRNSQLWVNGYYIGSHMSGYTGVSYDITDFLHFNSPNVIVVRVDASQYEGWFYEGAGIYRHVWLEHYDPLHLKADDGIFIRTQISRKSTEVEVGSELVNDGLETVHTSLLVKILDRNGHCVAKDHSGIFEISAGQTKSVQLSMALSSPILWNLDNPYLYRAEIVLLKQGRLVDSIVKKFGIRTFAFSPTKGFSINGRPLKICGVCCHQDHAGLGTALPDYLWTYRMALLKEFGVNALRTSHNPPAPELLDVCDSLGILVMDETRLLNSGVEYEKELADLVKRDRNHASVFLWSIGNEEHYAQRTEIGKHIALHQLALIHRLDPSRSTTYAADLGNVFEGVNEVIPIRGFNYNLNGIDAYHRDHPFQPIIGTEVASTVSTRGIYMKDTVRCYLPDYDSCYPRWASTSEMWWSMAAARPYFMGGFVWTGFDYRGEPTPYSWPNINSHFGILDVCGFPKTVAYYYKSWWKTDEDVLHLAPHWNWEGQEGHLIEVWVNSNADDVALFLNDRPLGRKPMPHNGHLIWQVPYEPGTLKAVGYRAGRTFTQQVVTTGKPYQIRLISNKDSIAADYEDAVVVNVEVTDSMGRLVPDASNLIHFSAEGPVSILGVGNGDPSSHEDDYCMPGKWQRHLFEGHAQLIVGRASSRGQIRIIADGEGLQQASFDVRAY